MKEFKNLKLPVDVHSDIKQRAAKNNMTMIKYIELCLAQCKSDKKD